MSLHALARIFTATGSYNRTELIQSHTTTSYLDQCANHGTHHITQETLGANLEIPAARLLHLNPFGLGQVAQRGLDISACLAEGAEVLDIEQQPGCLIHSFEIKLIRHLQGIKTMERIAMGMYIIMIGALDGRETCMQIVCDFPHVL